MTDKEIIKALEYCVGEEYTCENCPFQEIKHYDYENEMFEIMPNGKQYDDWSCERWLNVAVLDLIKRQQAEIERLTYTLWGVMHSVDKWLDGAELEQDEVNRAATMREKTLRIAEEKQAEIERLQKALFKQEDTMQIIAKEKQQCFDELQTAKSEAVKEFAEKLKEKSFKTIRNYGLTKDVVEVCDIDNLVKEMVGDE